jgi:hypothetical protein
MPLDKVSCKNDIKTLLTDMRTRAANSDDEFAERLTNIFEAFVKSGDGVYQNGTLIQSGTTAVISPVGTIVKMQ